MPQERTSNANPKAKVKPRPKARKNRRQQVQEELDLIWPSGKKDTYQGSVQLAQRRKANAKKRTPKPKPVVAQSQKKNSAAHEAMAHSGAHHPDGENKDFAPEVLPIKAVDGFTAAATFATAVMDPIAAKDAHLVDPFTTVPCYAEKYYSGFNATIYNGTTGADGSCAYFVRGSLIDAVLAPATIDAGSVITWTGGSTSDSAVYSTGFVCRIVSTYATFRVSQTGEPHTVTMYTVTIPADTMANQITNLITTTASGIGYATSMWGAATEHVVADDEVNTVVCAASQGTIERYTWSDATADRGVLGMSGKEVWFYGLRSTDRVEVRYGSHAEYIPYAIHPATVGSNLPTAVRATASAADLADAVGDVAASQPVRVDSPKHNGFEKTLNTVWGIIKKVANSDFVRNAANTILDLATGGIDRIFGLAFLSTPIRLRTEQGVKLIPPPLLWITLPKGHVFLEQQNRLLTVWGPILEKRVAALAIRPPEDGKTQPEERKLDTDEDFVTVDERTRGRLVTPRLSTPSLTNSVRSSSLSAR